MNPLVLDCTLRDGGYVNNWSFSNESTKKIIKSLIEAKIEIVECGFVSQKKGNKQDSTLFKEIEQVEVLIKSLDVKLDTTKFCVMINKGEYDFKTLPKFNSETNVVSGIRYAFHKKDWKDAIEDVKVMIKQGYEVYVQAMVTLSYSDIEIIQMLEEINKLDVFAMYIVDSFGAMFGDDFRRLHYLFENNLKKGIRLGYHAHNNLQLAYSNAVDFINIRSIDREIIIDSSIHGMGRGAGNLNTELFADFLNKKIQTNYNIIPLLETIDKFLEAIYRENYWGYSIAHFLSASFYCHPNYATYLVNTKTLSIVDMQKILSMLDDVERKGFSKDRIEELYINYKSKSKLSTNFDSELFRDHNLLIIASGSSTVKQKNIVDSFIMSNKPVVIAVNHIPSEYDVDYYFFSNQKRYEKFIDALDPKDVIVTSNIQVKYNSNDFKVIDYHDLVVMTSNKNDNVTVLLLNLLIKQGVKDVFLAGLDGYRFNEKNYNYQENDRVFDRKVLEQQNENLQTSLVEIRKKITLNFLTDTIFFKN